MISDNGPSFECRTENEIYRPEEIDEKLKRHFGTI